MIDTSKIRVGDEVTIRVTVAKISDGEIYSKTNTTDTSIRVPPERLVSHIPTPREIKAGDTVRIAEIDTNRWTVQAISGQRAWVSKLWENAVEDNRVVPLNTLRHAI